jgi:hypothetical protein
MPHRVLLVRSVWVGLVLSACSSFPRGDCVGGDPVISAANAGAFPTVTATSRVAYTINFGDVPVGQTFAGTLLLQDLSCDPLEVLSVQAPSDAEFALSLAAGTVVSIDSIGDGGLQMAASFRPFSPGSKEGSLVIANDSAIAPEVTLTFVGIGVDAG